MELSSLELSKIITCLNNEFNEETGKYYLNNTYQIFNNSFLFKFNHSLKDKKFLIVNPKIGIWTSEFDLKNKTAEGYVQSLRKNLTRGKIVKLEQPNGERICIITFETKKGIRKLICEFFREGNLIVVDQNNKILSCLNQLNVRHRNIIPGGKYELPPERGKDILNLQYEDILQIPQSNIEIAKWIGRNYSISKKYVEEILHLSNINNDILCSSLSQKQIDSLYRELKSFIKIGNSNNMNVWVYYEKNNISDISIIKLHANEQQEYKKIDSIIQALDKNITPELLKKEQKISQEPLNNKIMKLEQTIKLQTNAKNEQKKKAKLLRQIAEDLGNSTKIKTVFSKRKIEIISPKEGFFSVPTIDPKLSMPIKTTAIKLSSITYSRAKQIEKKIEKIEKAELKLQNQLDKLKKKTSQQDVDEIKLKVKDKPLWFERYRWFLTSQKTLVIGGRDTHSNNAIIQKHVQENDAIFHADIIGSPFFILREENKDQSLSYSEVAWATASFSRAWRTQTPVSVYWVKPDQVKKSATSGTYLPKGSFMIIGKKNMIKKIKLEIAVGVIKIQDRYTLMSGPLDAIKSNCIAFVVLKPGKIKASDIAKKIKQEIISMLENQTAKIYQAKSIDEFIKVLPAGGAEIIRKEKGDINQNKYN